MYCNLSYLGTEIPSKYCPFFLLISSWQSAACLIQKRGVSVSDAFLVVQSHHSSLSHCRNKSSILKCSGTFLLKSVLASKETEIKSLLSLSSIKLLAQLALRTLIEFAHHYRIHKHLCKQFPHNRSYNYTNRVSGFSIICIVTMLQAS